MRNLYPVSSIDFNDRMLLSYEHLVYLLGVQTAEATVTGLYDQIDGSGQAYMVSPSGIPHCGTNDGKYQVGLNIDSSYSYMVSYLRTDYILRKYLGLI